MIVADVVWSSAWRTACCAAYAAASVVRAESASAWACALSRSVSADTAARTTSFDWAAFVESACPVCITLSAAELASAACWLRFGSTGPVLSVGAGNAGGGGVAAMIPRSGGAPTGAGSAMTGGAPTAGVTGALAGGAGLKEGATVGAGGLTAGGGPPPELAGALAKGDGGGGMLGFSWSSDGPASAAPDPPAGSWPPPWSDPSRRAMRSGALEAAGCGVGPASVAGPSCWRAVLTFAMSDCSLPYASCSSGSSGRLTAPSPCPPGGMRPRSNWATWVSS